MVCLGENATGTWKKRFLQLWGVALYKAWGSHPTRVSPSPRVVDILLFPRGTWLPGLPTPCEHSRWVAAACSPRLSALAKDPSACDGRVEPKLRPPRCLMHLCLLVVLQAVTHIPMLSGLGYSFPICWECWKLGDVRLCLSGNSFQPKSQQNDSSECPNGTNKYKLYGKGDIKERARHRGATISLFK